MWLPTIIEIGRSALLRTGRHAGPAKPRRGLRPNLEQLEDRALPSSFSAVTVSDLIADIKAANTAGGTNTITLAKGTTFSVTQVNNTTDGSATGLPVIAAGDNLTIVGNNATIQRSAVSGTPGFRLFDVASGASLALQNLTVQNGSLGGGNGGAIYSNGSLTLSGVTVTGNSNFANYGGGVYIAGGTANLSNDLFSGNTSTQGGAALFVAGGSVTSIGDTFDANTATDDSGGAIYATGGSSVSLTDDHVTHNHAYGNNEGAIYITGGAFVRFCHDTIKDNFSGGIYADPIVDGGRAVLDHLTFEHLVNFDFNIIGHYSIVDC